MVSEKCKPVLEALDKGQIGDRCGDFREMRRMVGCHSTRLRDEKGMEFGPAMSQAWKDVKAKCEKTN